MSESSRAAKARYNNSEKGRKTAHELYLRRRVLHPREKLTETELTLRKSESDRRRSQTPERRAKQKEYHRHYHQTEKGKATRAKRNAQRYQWVMETDHPLTSAQWLEVLKANKYRCFYCKQTTQLTIDHVIALSKGGQHAKENVVPACGSCNSQKHDKMVMLL